MAFVEVTKKDHIAVVTMNRPEALNALNKAVFTDLEVALDDVEKDDEVYVVIDHRRRPGIRGRRRHRRDGHP